MKVLYIQPIHKSGMEKLAAKYEVIVPPDTRRETLLSAIRDVDVVVTRLTVLDAALMAGAKHLKAVAKHGVGVDNIDTAYCQAHGIKVLTTGDANSSTVAEHAMFAIGALYKHIPLLDRETRRGNWGSRDEVVSRDVRGKTLALVGYGRIGRCLAGMAGAGFDMRVRVFDPYADRAQVEMAGYTWCATLADALCGADVLSLHVPLTEDTRGMIGAAELSALAPDALVVNFARGGVVDEGALYAALMDGHIAGAALDAFAQEPPDTQNPLYQLDKVLLSPHCATFTEDSRRRMSMRLAEEIDRVLSRAPQGGIHA